jgi:hypothetical protein
MPEHCSKEGELVVLEQSGSWLNRQTYRCSEPLAGHSIGIHFPFPNPSISTVIRVDLLSGERFAQALEPSETSWQVPATSAGMLESLLQGARRSVVVGTEHVLGSFLHLAFLAGLCILGGLLGSVRLVTLFAVGQLAAVVFVGAAGVWFDPVVAEVCMAIAVVFLAREVLRDESPCHRIDGLAAAAGFFHGLSAAALLPGAAAGEPAWPQLLLVVLGMDAVLLVLAAIVVALGNLAVDRWRIDRLRAPAAYVVGVTATATALALALGRSVPEQTDQEIAAQLPGSLPSSQAGAVAGSRRVAPQTSDAPIQSFMAIEPFEIRHEVLLRLADVYGLAGLDLDRTEYLGIETQGEVARGLGEFVQARTALEIDGEAASGVINRADYVTVDQQGVLPLPTPVLEALDESVIGGTFFDLTYGMPGRVTMEWSGSFGAVAAIPATVIDPETSRSALLTPEASILTWRNELMDDPIPTVASVAVEPLQVPMPLLSLPFLLAAVVFMVVGLRGRKRALSFAAARVALALALIVTPFVEVALALPARVGAVPSDAQAKRILAGILPNVYRAFEFREETAVYDRLALSVTGETLADAYLEHRRALEMEERGGARARVDAVEVLEVDDVEARSEGGFEARATWSVGGTVTHFGHRHFRQNRYQAQVAVVPVDGTWKIRTIEVLEEERVR